MEAFGGVAALSRTSQAIGYGPLESTGDHDVVLLRISPKQMMAIGDSLSNSQASRNARSSHALPNRTVATSMGCALSRARIGMGDDELTVALPAGRVTELLEGLRSVRRADDAVVGYALADKSRF